MFTTVYYMHEKNVARSYRQVTD